MSPLGKKKDKWDSEKENKISDRETRNNPGTWGFGLHGVVCVCCGLQWWRIAQVTQASWLWSTTKSNCTCSTVLMRTASIAGNTQSSSNSLPPSHQKVFTFIRIGFPVEQHISLVWASMQAGTALQNQELQY